MLLLVHQDRVFCLKVRHRADKVVFLVTAMVLHHHCPLLLQLLTVKHFLDTALLQGVRKLLLEVELGQDLGPVGSIAQHRLEMILLRVEFLLRVA